MFPPVHPAIGYLALTLVSIRYWNDQPDGPTTIAVIIGSLLPDFIDQSVAIIFGLATTRTLGHSLLFAMPLVAVSVIVARIRGTHQRTAGAFGLGYLLHLVADAVWPALLRIPSELEFLFWPVTPSPPYDGQKPLFALDALTITTLWFELPVLLIGAAVWIHHGMPGVRTTVRLLRIR